jgi:hypothetical protein
MIKKEFNLEQFKIDWKDIGTEEKEGNTQKDLEFAYGKSYGALRDIAIKHNLGLRGKKSGRPKIKGGKID